MERTINVRRQRELAKLYAMGANQDDYTDEEWEEMRDAYWSVMLRIVDAQTQDHCARRES